MRGTQSKSRKSARLARLSSASALACLIACGVVGYPAHAQTVEDLAPSVPAGSQMLLEADQLIYDRDANTVTAAGGVQIDYGGNKLVADRVTYDRNTSRLIASGNVQIVDDQGTKIFSDEIDITDDFADGFVNALRVETADKTYFAAESAKREGGVLTTFNNGVYTACEPCEDQPDKAPIWRIKARKIIWNGQEKTVRFENSRFEFFGVPVVMIPSFTVPDPTVKRKSGFLFPRFGYNSELGFSAGIPYYLALSDTYDLTLTGSGYTKQGFLGEAEWRQRFNNGEYSFTVAGIRQENPDEFGANTVNSGPKGDPNRNRYMFGTNGRFQINPRWVFGWKALIQSDKNFANTYGIGDYGQAVHRSEIYLTGLDDRNFFDLRAQHYEVQEDILDSAASARAEKQPWVLPTFDYSFTPDEPVMGGELNIDINSRLLHRSEADIAYRTAFNSGTPVERVRGIEGTSSRITAEAEWKRTIVTDGGLVITPLLAFQADTIHVDQSAASVAAINAMAANPQINAATDIRSAYNRYMATAGLELRWPVLFSATSSSHVLEPMAQVFARPDEHFAETLGVPNEDAQSFVFDASTLFERDKFSGYDRIEGGTRVNLGLRYSGSFDNGWTTNALFGQSYHIAGINSFASPDLVNAGAYSGLESNTSDFVGLVGFATPGGIAASASARFDEQNFEMRRGEVKLGYTTRPFSVSAKYAYIQAQPLYGFNEDRQETTLAGSMRFAEYWRVFGSGTYDIEKKMVARNSFGFAYDDECFSYLMTFSQTRDRNTKEVTQSIGFNISFRTLGDFGSSTSEFANN